jgi:hypothetical protein
VCICVIVAHAQPISTAGGEARDSVRVSDSVAVSGDQRIGTPTQRTNDPEYLPAWHDMFTRIPGDWGRFVGDNFRIEKVPAIAGLVGLTAALILSDNETWKATSDFSNHSVGRRDITHLFAEPGDGKTILAVAGGFALAGWTLDNNRALRTASQLVESYLACGVSVQVLKHISGRERPERQSRPGGYWRLFPNQIEYHRSVPKFDAFPSGHTAAAMAMVTVVIENYPEEKWLKPVGYSIVGLVGFGLVAKGWHWYSDFPLAIVLGYQFGKIAAHPETIDVVRGDTMDSPKLSITPALGIHGAGVRLALAF